MLYRFQIELSNIDSGIYETLDFRLSQHPSETVPYLLTRTLAYILSFQNGLEFSAKGLSDPDLPALQKLSDNGSFDLWIEIGNPTARKLHRASKASKQVVIYTYKNVEVLINEINSRDVHKVSAIQIFPFNTKFLLELEQALEKNNRWSVIIQDGQLNIDIGTTALNTEIKKLGFN